MIDKKELVFIGKENRGISSISKVLLKKNWGMGKCMENTQIIGQRKILQFPKNLNWGP